MSRDVAISEVATVNPRAPRTLLDDLSRRVHFVPMAKLHEDGHVEPNGDRAVGEVSKGYTYFENGDVIVAKITPCMENGKAAFISRLPLQIAFGSTEFHVLRPTERIDGKYLFYMVWNSAFRAEASKNMTGSAGQKRVPADFFNRFAIPLPPLAEQKRIAGILDKADAIRCKRREEQTIVRSIVPASFYRLFGDPGKNSHGWKTESLGTVAQLDRGRSRHRPRDEPSLYHGPYPFIQTGDVANSDGVITSYTQTYSEAGLAQSKLWPAGTLCITIAANIAKTAIMAFEGCFPDSIVGLVSGPKLTVEFIREWFVAMEKRIDAAATQVAQKNINLEILNDLPIIVPPMSLQREFSSQVLKTRKLAEKGKDAVAAADDLFNSLVQRAFRGEL